jgi:non-specific serine/threonine protein kinase
VVTAAPLVSYLLAAGPRLKILVTSRLLLRIEGEYALPVPPLGVPDPEAAVSPDTLRQSAAVQLFAQRGQAISPTFTVTDDNAPLVADICRRLDGVPLAIELAAARVNHLSLPMLWERLDRRLPLLTGGGRDRPPRLQTMRNAIAWSYQLLSVDEQTLFRRLAVFTGGCTLEAAEQVGGDESASTLDLIAALVDASLLQSELDSTGTTRYRMLEIIRDFAQEQLTASGEEELIRARHAAYFVAVAEQLEWAVMLPGADRVLVQLEAEQANLRVALAWLAEHDEARALLRAAASLGYYWSGQGYYHEGRTWLERALAHAGDTAPIDRAKALVSLGAIEAYQGAVPEAVAHLTQGLAASHDQGQAFTEAHALLGLGALAIAQGDHDRGAALLETSISTARTVPDQRLAAIMIGWGLANLAMIPRTAGDFALATERLEAALQQVREAGYVLGSILILGDLGDLARDQGDFERAMARYREALALGQTNPGTRVVFDVIEAVGIMATATGEAERGAMLLGAAEALRERIGLRFRVHENEAALEQAVAASRATLGEQRFATEWSVGRTLTPAAAVAAALAPGSSRAGDGVMLTPREAEILRLLAAGMTDPAIAAALFISVRTVENHVARIFAKLGVHTRTAAVTTAIAAGLVDPARPSPA